ncbi:hypothetical protein ACHAXM_007729 [Skeletonema potamos]
MTVVSSSVVLSVFPDVDCSSLFSILANDEVLFGSTIIKSSVSRSNTRQTKCLVANKFKIWNFILHTSIGSNQ